MTTSKTFIHALSIAAVLACATPLSAMAAEAQAPDATAPAASPAEEAFKVADANHDPDLAKEGDQSPPGHPPPFPPLDKNTDGVLSYDEFQAGLKPTSSK